MCVYRGLQGYRGEGECTTYREEDGDVDNREGLMLVIQHGHRPEQIRHHGDTCARYIAIQCRIWHMMRHSAPVQHIMMLYLRILLQAGSKPSGGQAVRQASKQASKQANRLSLCLCLSHRFWSDRIWIHVSSAYCKGGLCFLGRGTCPPSCT